MSIDEKDEEHLINRTAEHNPNECNVCNQCADKVREFYKILEIPIIKSTTQTGKLSTDIKVQGYKLYDILMDEEKLRVLVSKLRNKAFW